MPSDSDKLNVNFCCTTLQWERQPLHWTARLTWLRQWRMLFGISIDFRCWQLEFTIGCLILGFGRYEKRKTRHFKVMVIKPPALRPNHEEPEEFTWNPGLNL